MTDAPSRWLSAHLYYEGPVYGPASDGLVLGLAAPFARWAAVRGLLGRWFFVRYEDEGGVHLRLRLEAADGGEMDRLAEELEGFVQATVAASGPACRLAWVPYEPETGRYGGPDGIGLAESLFHRSSEAAVELLGRLGAERSSRLGTGLLAFLIGLSAFGLDRREASAFAGAYAEGYLRMLVGDAADPSPLRQAYRRGFERQAERLSGLIRTVWRASDSAQGLPAAVAAYRGDLREARRAFGRLHEEGRLRSEAGNPFSSLHEAIARILPSYLHMTSNRLGISIPEEAYLTSAIERVLGNLRSDAGAHTAAEPSPARSTSDLAAQGRTTGAPR